MTKTKVIATVGIVTVIILAMFLSIFWYIFTPFYSDCKKIETGMNRDKVESIMQSYINSDRFSVSREGVLWGEGLYISSNASGNQCNMSVREGKVDRIEIRFE